MSCSIKWNLLNFPEWEQRFNRVNRSTILQSYAYARAVCPLYRQTARWGLIEIDGQEAGLVQVTEAGIFRNFLHAAMVDRGPLWFQGFGDITHFENFVKALSEEFPRRIGRRRRFIPEVADSEAVRKILEKNKFRRHGDGTYETLCVDLQADEAMLRQNLKKSWRGTLSKAEKRGVKVEWDEKGEHLQWFLTHYMQDKDQRGYDGPDPSIVKALAETFAVQKNLLIGRALLDKKAIGAILVLCHGQAATYQTGWTTAEGRSNGAHHILLWEALRKLKARGIKDFDLGGVNDESAKGVKTFKEGLGGKLIVLPGLYT